MSALVSRRQAVACSGAVLVAHVGLAHEVIGTVLYRGSLGAIWAAGVFNTIRPGVDFDRQAVFWFLTFSPLVFLLGQIANRALERSDASPLSLIGRYLVGLGVVGGAVLPISGNWTLMAVGLFVLRSARQARTPEGDVEHRARDRAPPDPRRARRPPGRVRTRYVEQVPAVALVLEGADHADVKTVEGEASLREFLAGMSTFMPAWVRFLFRARVVLVWALRLDERAIPEPRPLRPEQVPMQPGEQAFIFTVRQAEEDRYWLADVEDRNLSSSLGVVVEPLGGGRNRFHVVTVVHYKNWAGPVYFNVIRPLHHLLVWRMTRAGLRAARR